MRLGDYRLIFDLDQGQQNITLLMLGPRGNIYDRLDVSGADGEPAIAIVANRPELLEPQPPADRIGKATIAVATRPKVEHRPDTLLPNPLTRERLGNWQIPEAYHEALTGITTEEGLLEAQGIPQQWHERVMNLALQMPIEEVIERPVALVPEPERLEALQEKGASLASYLLRLDTDQEGLLSNFDAGQAPGPWLVKGGPGTGKTVVTVYAIRDVLERARQEGRQPRILFTTFTRALSTATRQLLQYVDIDPDGDEVHIENIDSLARKLSPSKTSVLTESTRAFDELFRSAVKAAISADRSFPWSVRDEGFLMEEVTWVILGRGLTHRDDYLQADRSGRPRRLDEGQRRHLWRFYLSLRDQLAKAKRRLFEDVLLEALEHAEATYDHVFVDEVHDLKPIAVELCARLCKDPRQVMLTLDPNQSIYGARQGWAETLPASMAAPRSVVLRRNHRSTSELWEAQQQILKGLVVHDPETLAEQGELSGPVPRLVGVDKENEGEALAAFLHESLIEERASLGCAAVLCPTNRDCHSVAKQLPSRLRARVMESKDQDLKHDGVKVMTMHAAKGLQFPVVVVARMDKGRFPMKAPAGINSEDHAQQSRRLLFVACSRAMRRLMVVHVEGKPSPLLEGLDDGAWLVEP